MVRLGSAFLAAVALCGFAAPALAQLASVPTFETGNLVVFPDRDFVTIEGFDSKIGQEFHVEVKRKMPGSDLEFLVGEARGIGHGGGGVLTEINHPGGYCWGAETAPDKCLQVTPNIKGSDIVYISWPKSATLDKHYTRVQDAYIDSVTRVGPVVTIKGFVGEHTKAHPDWLENRFVNPDLKDTAVGRRDVRAVVALVNGLADPTPVDTDGVYTSSVWYDDNFEVNHAKAPAPPKYAFTARYTFGSEEIATIVAGSEGPRILTWQVQDAAANRQGITIHEYKVAGGPGLGGCPGAPSDVVTASTGFAWATTEDNSVHVHWQPPAVIPESPVLTGFIVTAYLANPADTKRVPGLSVYVDDGAAVSAVVPGASPTTEYKVEVRAVAAGDRPSAAYSFSTKTQADAPVISAPPPVTDNGGNPDPPVAIPATTTTPNLGNTRVAPQLAALDATVTLTATTAGSTVWFARTAPLPLLPLAAGATNLDQLPDPLTGYKACASPCKIPIVGLLLQPQRLDYFSVGSNGEKSDVMLAYYHSTAVTPEQASASPAQVKPAPLPTLGTKVDPTLASQGNTVTLTVDPEKFTTIMYTTEAAETPVFTACATPCVVPITKLKADPQRLRYYVQGTDAALTSTTADSYYYKLGEPAVAPPAVKIQAVSKGVSLTLGAGPAVSTTGEVYSTATITMFRIQQVTALPNSVNVAGFTAIESGATFHILPATGDLTVRRYYAVSAATAALVWSEPTTVSAVPGSFDSITITSARFKTGDFRIDGTADFDTTPGAPATTITLWLKNNAGALVRVTNGANPGVPLPPIPVVAGVAPALPSQGTWTFRFRAGAAPAFNAAVPPLIWAVSNKGGQFPVDTGAPGFVITPARRLQSTFTVEAFN